MAKVAVSPPYASVHVRTSTGVDGTCYMDSYAEDPDANPGAMPLSIVMTAPERVIVTRDTVATARHVQVQPRKPVRTMLPRRLVLSDSFPEIEVKPRKARRNSGKRSSSRARSKTENKRRENTPARKR